MLRRRIWRAISSAASRLVWRMVFRRPCRAFVAAGVHVDGDERLGLVDDDVTAARQPDLAVEGVVDLFLDVVSLEDGRRLVVDAGCGCCERLEIWPTRSSMRSTACASSQITASISSVRKSRTVRSIEIRLLEDAGGRGLRFHRLLDVPPLFERAARDRGRNSARAGLRRRCGR